MPTAIMLHIMPISFTRKDVKTAEKSYYFKTTPSVIMLLKSLTSDGLPSKLPVVPSLIKNRSVFLFQQFIVPLIREFYLVH